jgi:m7GpppX diphosphatase
MTPLPVDIFSDALLPQFELKAILNQVIEGIYKPEIYYLHERSDICLEQTGRQTILQGTINSEPALLILERTAFPTDASLLSTIPATLRTLEKLGTNDRYHWYLATSGGDQPPDLKINLIYPCTEKHVAQFAPQKMRTVQETPEIYKEQVKPYMMQQREKGRLDWVFNIIEGKAEQESVVYRERSGTALNDVSHEGFLLMADLHWDRKTLPSLHLLGLVERRDIWTLRDLTKQHVVWLKHMHDKMIDATVKLYPQISRDQLKLFVHCEYGSLKYELQLIMARPTRLLSLSHSCCSCCARARP